MSNVVLVALVPFDPLPVSTDQKFETLANSCGISTERDPRLAVVFKAAAGANFGPELVSLVPLMFAAAFVSPDFWKTCFFNAKLNGG